jgi:hypothetical protein
MDQENVTQWSIHYSAIRNNDIWFKGKWMQLENIMLSEVSQVQKDKGCMLSLTHG